jgi:hypothetical protein
MKAGNTYWLAFPQSTFQQIENEPEIVTVVAGPIPLQCQTPPGKSYMDEPCKQGAMLPVALGAIKPPSRAPAVCVESSDA